jgi:hypothetical protein
MISVSRTALEQVLADIRNGVTYPDRWPDVEPETTEEEPEIVEVSEDEVPWYTKPDVSPWTDPYWR